METDYDEYLVKWSAAALYGGGADTVCLNFPFFLTDVLIIQQTVSAIYSFFLAMVLNPEIQRKAQEEIDSVVGNDRLPSYSDRDNLPYVNAVLKETLRFFPIVPMGQCA